MNKKICKRIRLIASNLPDMVDGNGIKVNHYRRMKRAYIKKGANAILEHANKAANALAMSLNQHELMEQVKPLV